MESTRKCPKCGSPMPADAPQGLCPRCVMEIGLASDAETRASGVASGPAGTSNPAGSAPRPSAAPPHSHGFIPPTPAELAPLFPQLEILELLGRGGMGAVYKARQPGLDRFVALKILPPEVSSQPAFAERFTREARALARLNHPNIVMVYDFGRTVTMPLTAGSPEHVTVSTNSGGLYYFIMEFVDGANLRQSIRAGTITPTEALAIVPQICAALQFAHDEGVVHRDIKPENVLLDKKGRVKIADFGLAKLTGREGDAASVNLTAADGTMGTLHYMAPEQFSSARSVDHRADIYSLGVTFYEMLTGELPLGRFAPPSKMVQIDVRLDDVVLRTLAQMPELRYQHVSEVKTDLDTIAGTPAPSVPTAFADRGTLFRLRVQWRDVTDLLLNAAATLWVVGVFYALPFLLIYLASSIAGLNSHQSSTMGALGGAFVFVVGFVTLALGSVQSMRVDASGLTLNRYIGPSRFVPWSAVRRIEPISRWEAIRQVWLWPGFPPHGSMMTGTTRDWYRIDCQDYCWYFSPKEVQPFLDAIHRSQQSASESASKPAAPAFRPAVASPNAPTPAAPAAAPKPLLQQSLKEAAHTLFTPDNLDQPDAPASAKWRHWIIFIAIAAASFLFTYSGLQLSLIVTNIFVFLYSGVLFVMAWNKRGTRTGLRLRYAAILFLCISLAIPLIIFFSDPQPILNSLYKITDSKPGPHDADFIRGLFMVLVFGSLIALIRTWLKLRRERLAQPPAAAHNVNPATAARQSHVQMIVLACVVGLAACAIPCHYVERGLWGFNSASDSDHVGVSVIGKIEPFSPADTAGLKFNDYIVSSTDTSSAALWTRTRCGGTSRSAPMWRSK